MHANLRGSSWCLFTGYRHQTDKNGRVVFLSKEPSIKEKVRAFQLRYFPERQIFLRSEGRVRFVTIGGHLQMAASMAAAVLILWTIVTSAHFMMRDGELEDKTARIAEMRSEYEALGNALNTLEKDVIKRTEILESRQKTLEELSGIDLPEETIVPIALPDTTGPADEAPADDPVETSFFDLLFQDNAAHAAVPGPADRRNEYLHSIQMLGYKQNIMSERLLARVNDRIDQIDTVLADTKITTDDLIRMATKTDQPNGVGGPYLPEESVKPLFQDEDLTHFTSLIDQTRRLHLATMILDSLPSGEPAAKYYISSRFGRRRDPMTKKWAQHKALDMAGWPGTAIQAATGGTVLKAGWWGPYGKMIEIDHGNGFRTRYGHMRKLKVKKGDKVVLGQAIGEMGKTGRSTSSHLHYEVWFDGEVQDPLPYLKAGNDVLEIKGRASRQKDDQANS